MAAKEIWDYVSAATPDYNATLEVTPQRVATDGGEKDQMVHQGDDGSEEIIAFTTDPIFYITLLWDKLSEADAGTIFDFYFDTGKGNGMARSFKWSHVDDHIYTVRFATPLARQWKPANIHGIVNIKLKVLGQAP